MTWPHVLLILLTVLVILTPRERDGWKRKARLIPCATERRAEIDCGSGGANHLNHLAKQETT